LHSRILLDLQAHIVNLEEELDQRDELDQDNGLSGLMKSRMKDNRYKRVDDDGRRPRDAIFAELRAKLLEYGQLQRLAAQLPIRQVDLGMQMRSLSRHRK